MVGALIFAQKIVLFCMNQFENKSAEKILSEDNTYKSKELPFLTVILSLG
jgi:hypothetical protein